MIGLLSSIAAPLLGSLFKVIDKAVTDKDMANQLKAALQQQALAGELDGIKSAAEIILAEAKGDSWIQRSWRPILMLVIVAIIANNYLIGPYLEAISGWSIVLPLDDRLWDLMTLGIGGYIAGRTAEKGIKAWRNPDKP